MVSEDSQLPQSIQTPQAGQLAFHHEDPANRQNPRNVNVDNGDSNDNLDINNFGKRPHRSEVWDYFEKFEWPNGMEKKTAKCTIADCPHREFSCGNGGTTKPLWRHLEHAHWPTYVKTEEYQRKRKKIETTEGNQEETLSRVSSLFIVAVRF